MSNLAPIVGVLQPGEETCRHYPAKLPEGQMAVLQKAALRGVNLQILEQSDTSMRLINRGTTFAPYMIVFMTEKQLRAMLAAKELVSQIFDAAATRKRKK